MPPSVKRGRDHTEIEGIYPRLRCNCNQQCVVNGMGEGGLCDDARFGWFNRYDMRGSSVLGCPGGGNAVGKVCQCHTGGYLVLRLRACSVREGGQSGAASPRR